jgi:hypothetical protein
MVSMSLTVRLPEEPAERVAVEAVARRQTPEQVALEAIEAALPVRRRLSFSGIGRSGDGRGGAQADELIAVQFAGKTAPRRKNPSGRDRCRHRVILAAPMEAIPTATLASAPATPRSGTRPQPPSAAAGRSRRPDSATDAATLPSRESSPTSGVAAADRRSDGHDNLRPGCFSTDRVSWHRVPRASGPDDAKQLGFVPVPSR